MVALRVEPYDPDLSLRWEVRRVVWKLRETNCLIYFEATSWATFVSGYEVVLHSLHARIECDNVGDCGVFGNSGAAWISTRALEMRELFKFNSASRIVA
ncbi:hypothetical protein Syun_000680 [Stephania yunnanensis]|uniref:Uncharacterized protein n=1 Tax=Stephania yunnanensis TaxID=152371 RepID=A0AAP0LF93_9MAGN